MRLVGKFLVAMSVVALAIKLSVAVLGRYGRIGDVIY